MVKPPSRIHRDDLNPVSVDVSEEDLRPPLDDVDQLVDTLSATLALPVRLVQEQRLQELLPEPSAAQHRQRQLRKSAGTVRTKERAQLVCVTLTLTSTGNLE